MNSNSLLSLFFLCFVLQTSKAQWVEETSFNGPINDIVEYDGDLFILGNFTERDGLVCYWSSKFNGTSFEDHTTLLSGSNIYEAAVFNSDLYVVGGLTNNSNGGVGLSTWNGSSWLTTNSFVTGQTSIVTDDVNLYVGSDNGVVSKSFGSGYTELPTLEGFNNRVSALSFFNGNLIVGGSFTEHNGNVLKGVSEWDGSNWRPMGNGLSGGVGGPHIKSFATYRNKFYAGGVFTTIDGLAARYLATWNGLNWSPVESGFIAGSGKGISDMVVTNNLLFVVGDFTNVGDVISNKVAYWDGIDWYEMDLETPSEYAKSVAVYNNKLFVGTYDDTTSYLYSFDLDSIPLKAKLTLSDPSYNLWNSSVYFQTINIQDSSVTTIDSFSTSNMGCVLFDRDLEGTLMKIVPSSVFYPNQSTTYYPSVSTIQEATGVPEDVYPIEFSTVVKLAPFFGAVGVVSGRVVYGNGMNNPLGEPVPDLDLVLVNDEGVVIYNKRTNNSGEFHFKNLIDDTYYVWADFPFLDNSVAPEYVLTRDNREFKHRVLAQHNTHLEDLSPTSVSERETVHVELYPNPCREWFTINWEGEGEYQFEIFNLLGELVLNVEAEKDEFIIVSSLPNGVYYVQINMNEEVLSNRRLVIER